MDNLTQQERLGVDSLKGGLRPLLTQHNLPKAILVTALKELAQEAEMSLPLGDKPNG